MTKKAIQNNANKTAQHEMILAEMICGKKETKIFPGKEIISGQLNLNLIADIDALIFGEIDGDHFYHSEK